MDERTVFLDPDGWEGAAVAVSGVKSSLGRGDEADVQINEPSISRRHVLLHETDVGWMVEELGSTHGTTVNWVRCEPGERVRLDGGDRLELGGMAYMVRLDGAAFERKSPPPRPKKISHGSVSASEYKTRGTLLLRLKADDASAREVSWQEFYTTYAPIIAGFARRAGCPRSETDDIVHEVMAGFYKASERFEYDPKMGRFRGYLKTATLNALRQRYRKDRGKTSFDPEWIERQPEKTEVLWSHEWLGQLIVRAIETVKVTTNIESKTWEAFELYGRRGVPVDEVSDRLDMAPAAIRKAKSRISQLIRDEIDRLRIEEG